MHTRGQFIDFCKKAFGDYQLTNAGKNIQVLCPICKSFKKNLSYSKKKLAIETSSHVLHCWSCGYKSKNLLHLFKKYKTDYLELYIENFKNSVLLEDLNVQDIVETKKIILPEDYILLATNLDTEDVYINNARNYLKARGIDKEEDMWYWRFGISNASEKLIDRVIVPSFDFEGKLNYYTARSIFDNTKQKYINPYINREDIVFNEINIQWDKELTIVEGVFDLIKCNENATCILGSDLTANYELFQKIILNKTPIVLGLDPDAIRKTLKIAERLYEFCVPVKIIEYRSDNDIGSMTKNQFNDLLLNAKLFDTEYMLKYKIQTMLS